jgi:hypothetical protein
LDLFGSDITDIRLEEINESNSNEYYLTISFLVPNKNISPTVTSTFGIMVNPYIRAYKNVVINKENGDIIAIKMHDVIIDTNIFILFLAGQINENKIKNYTRNSLYTKEDYYLLLNILSNK